MSGSVHLNRWVKDEVHQYRQVMSKDDLPGHKGESFHLYFKEAYFNKKDILSTADGVELIVTKVYKNRWWRRLLRRLGFKLAYCECKLKVKINE